MLFQGLQAFAGISRKCTHRWCQQVTECFLIASPYPAPQLVQVAQSELVGIIDNNGINVRNVHPAFYNVGTYQHIVLLINKVQDALLQTLKHLDGFESRHPGALQAYLRQAVMNRLRDHLRRVARAPGRVDLDEVLAGQSPIEQAVGPDTMAAYEQALTRLKPEEREAVVGRIGTRP